MSNLTQLRRIIGAQLAADNVPADKVITDSLADDVVTDTKIAPNAVDNTAMADDAVGVAELSATGSPSATTYLRGDNSWATPASPNNATITIAAGTGLTGGGSFTTDQSGNATITLNATAAIPAITAVGSYVFVRTNRFNTAYNPNTTIAFNGTNENYGAVFGTAGGSVGDFNQPINLQAGAAISGGTWRSLGAGVTNQFACRLFVRIS